MRAEYSHEHGYHADQGRRGWPPLLLGGPLVFACALTTAVVGIGSYLRLFCFKQTPMHLSPKSLSAWHPSNDLGVCHLKPTRQCLASETGVQVVPGHCTFRNAAFALYLIADAPLHAMLSTHVLLQTIQEMLEARKMPDVLMTWEDTEFCPSIPDPVAPHAVSDKLPFLMILGVLPVNLTGLKASGTCVHGLRRPWEHIGQRRKWAQE